MTYNITQCPFKVELKVEVTNEKALRRFRETGPRAIPHPHYWAEACWVQSVPPVEKLQVIRALGAQLDGETEGERGRNRERVG